MTVSHNILRRFLKPHTLFPVALFVLFFVLASFGAVRTNALETTVIVDVANCPVIQTGRGGPVKSPRCTRCITELKSTYAYREGQDPLSGYCAEELTSVIDATNCPTDASNKTFCEACITAGGQYTKYSKLTLPMCSGVSNDIESQLVTDAGFVATGGNLSAGLFSNRTNDIPLVLCGRPRQEAEQSGLVSLGEASKCCASDLSLVEERDSTLNMVNSIHAGCLPGLLNTSLKLAKNYTNWTSYLPGVGAVRTIKTLFGSGETAKACLSDLAAIPLNIAGSALPIDELAEVKPPQSPCVGGADIAGDADPSSPTCQCVDEEDPSATAQIQGRRLAAFVETQKDTVVLGSIPPTNDKSKCEALYGTSENTVQECLDCTGKGKWYSTELKCTTSVPNFQKIMGQYTKGSAHLCERYVKDSELNACKGCAASNGIYTGIGCISTGIDGFAASAIQFGISLGGGLAFLCIIYAAFIMQTSRGNPERLKKAREYLNSCIIGLLIIIFSVFILRVVGYEILRIPGFEV